jgi:WD40-like Beta Propeller Repeat
MMRTFVAALVVLGLALPATADAAWRGGNGMIAVGCGAAICTFNPDGSGGRVLPQHPQGQLEYDPSFSPDGNRIVFSRVTAETFPFSDIWIMNADGSGQRRLTFNTNDSEPSWSPDGSRIVFRSSRNLAGARIYTMRPDGSDVRAVPTTTGSCATQPTAEPCVYDGSPQWTRDGSRLIVQRGIYANPACSSNAGEILSFAPNGSDQRSLTVPGNAAPDMSPDGRRIVVMSGRNNIACSEPVELWTFNVDGSDQRAVYVPARLADEGDNPVYSPDGRQIMFAVNRTRIGFVGAGGGRASIITTSVPFPFDSFQDPDWQPCVAGVTVSCTSTPPSGGGGSTGPGGGTGQPVPNLPTNPADTGEPPPRTFARVRLAARQRGGRVRGSLTLGQAPATVKLRLIGRAGALKNKSLGTARKVFRNTGRVSFAVALNRRGARALKRQRALKLMLSVRGSAPGARVATVKRPVTLRRR